jgi:sec-independent protein translocase protein TatB
VFGLDWGEILIILLVGIFVLGPERIPVAVRWITDTARKVRGMAATAQSDLRREIGPELDELRRQVNELRSMADFDELKRLRELNPKRFIQKNVLGDEFSGGVTGFLGLTGTGTAAEQANAAAGLAAPDAAAPAAHTAPVADRGDPAILADVSYPTRRTRSPLAPGELAPFDPDGT